MLPTSLESATVRMMRPDSIAREREVFGDDFVDHYGGTREHEIKLWNEAVTNWERKDSFYLQRTSILLRLGFQLSAILSWLDEKKRFVSSEQ